MRKTSRSKNDIKMSQAIVEVMEQRTLLTAAPIALDPTFGNGGIAGGAQAAGYGLLTASDPATGAIVVVGYSLGVNPYSGPYELQKYTSTGAVVTNFGSDGLVTSSVQALPMAVAVQSSGKILVLAQKELGTPLYTYDLTQYTATGAIDSTFGTNGTYQFSVGGGETLYPNYSLGSIFLLPKGDIVLPGAATTATAATSALTVLNPNGTLDKSFGKDGVATGISGYLNAVTTDASGDLVAVGWLPVTSSSIGAGLVERFTANGQLDTSFGTNGATISTNATDFFSVHATASGVQVSGWFETVPDDSDISYALQINHYTRNGLPDTTFGSGTGHVSPSLKFQTGYSSFQADGKLLVSYPYAPSQSADPTLVRLNADGSLDKSFGNGGYDDIKSTVGTFGIAEPFVGLSLDSTGRILLPAVPADSLNGLDFGVSRLQSNGAPDPSIGPDGTAVGRPLFSSATALAELPDGQTLVAGNATIGGVIGLYIQRDNSNGSVDGTFAPDEGFAGQSGYVFVATPTAGASQNTVNVAGLSLSATGEIYLGESGIGIARFNAMGQLDKTFGTKGVALDSELSGFLLQSNGMILAAGGNSTLTRLNSSGKVDTTFGHAGTITAPTGFTPTGTLLAVQPDGKILVGGTSTPISTSIDLSVLRLNANGLVDTSFGTNGLAVADQLPAEINSGGFRAEYESTPTALAVLPNGTIAIAGSDGGTPAPGAGFSGPTIAEFLPSGRLNPAFGTGGQTVTYNASANVFAEVSSLIVQPDGSLVVAGTQSTGISSEDSSLFLLQYSSNGTPGSFVTTQIVKTNPAGIRPDNVQQAAVAGSSGTVIISGYTTPVSLQDAAFVARYTTGTTPLTGAIIGTAGSYQNAGNTIAKAFDGILTNYFDGPTANGDYAGLNLGTAKVITHIGFDPRTGFDSRMVGGVFQGANNASFSNAATLYTVTAAPTSGTLTTVNISNSTPFQYVRYLAPNGSYGDVGELAFYGTTPTTPTKVAGTAIGTPGSYRNHGTTIANAFDGNLSTFFDAPDASGDWVGLDLGTAQVVTQVKYAPRAGYQGRMVGGEIQASNSADFSSGVVTLYTISSTPAAGVLTTRSLTNTKAYRYYRYIGPANSYCNIAELEFDG
jgi:uncharacterized delta-60 repeat protein